MKKMSDLNAYIYIYIKYSWDIFYSGKYRSFRYRGLLLVIFNNWGGEEFRCTFIIL